MDKDLNVLVEAEATDSRYAIRSTVGYVHELLRSAASLQRHRNYTDRSGLELSTGRAIVLNNH